jgi:hypothetical protein
MAGHAVTGINETIKVHGTANYHHGNNQQPVTYRRRQELTEKPVQTGQDKANNSPDHGEISYGPPHLLRANLAPERHGDNGQKTDSG